MPNNETRRYRGPSGQVYTFVTGSSATWAWNDSELIFADDDQKSFQTCEIPPDNKMDINLYVPFVFDIDSNRLRREWDMKLIGNSDHQVTIDATPRVARVKGHVSQCRVVLDTRNWHPIAIRLLDASSMEIQYRVQKWRTGDEASNGWNWDSEFTDFASRGYTNVFASRATKARSR